MSDAVALERISKTVGYKLLKGDFRTQSPNLPQRIAILGEANNANQSGLSTEPVTLKTAQQAGQLFGYGSPIHMVMRILLPRTNSGVGGIPIIAYPQVEAGGSTSKIITITPSGTATKNGVHTVVIGGRYGVDGVSYDINIEEGDGPTEINAKIETAVNNVLGSPMIADDWGYETRLESKWKGLTAEGLQVRVDDNDVDLGIDYTIESTQTGSGTPDIDASLEKFGNEWNTIVVNTYGAVESIMDSLETFNGIPDPTTPTGRYAGIIMKPFIALTGSVLEDPSSLTDGRLNDVTIAICPAPNSEGLPLEAAANMAVLFARTSQDNPHLDVSGQYYPDMPVPTSIGAMDSYESRDAIVKKGCSTVHLVSDRYIVDDFVTTYHPEGENPPQFRYCRNLVIDFNVRYSYYLQEQINLVDHVIAADDAEVNAPKVIKPKQWKQIVGQLANDLVTRALVADAAFMQDSIVVNIGTSNPDRLETTFNYQRTGYARISSTDATAGFNFSN